MKPTPTHHQSQKVVNRWLKIPCTFAQLDGFHLRAFGASFFDVCTIDGGGNFLLEVILMFLY